jgi:hypothetical protein
VIDSFRRILLAILLLQVSGTLFGWTGVGADRVLVVCQPGSTTYTNDITLLKHDAVQAARSVIFPTSGDDSNQPLPAVDAQRSKEREERAVRAAQLEASKIGTGVSEQAQAVFDAVSKTMPCRWDGQTIVVLDEVRNCHLFLMKEQRESGVHRQRHWWLRCYARQQPKRSEAILRIIICRCLSKSRIAQKISRH